MCHLRGGEDLRNTSEGMQFWVHQVPATQSSWRSTLSWPRTSAKPVNTTALPLAPVQEDHVCPLSKDLWQRHNVCSMSLAKATRSRWVGDSTKVSKSTMWCRCTEKKRSSKLSGCHIGRITARVHVSSGPTRLKLDKEWKKILACKAKLWQVGKEQNKDTRDLIEKMQD